MTTQFPDSLWVDTATQLDPNGALDRALEGGLGRVEHDVIVVPRVAMPMPRAPAARHWA